MTQVRSRALGVVQSPFDDPRTSADRGDMTQVFELISEVDSSDESLGWFQQMRSRIEREEPPPVTFSAFLCDEFGQIAANQVANLAERRSSIGARGRRLQAMMERTPCHVRPRRRRVVQRYWYECAASESCL